MKEIGASRVPEKIVNHTRLKSRPPGQRCCQGHSTLRSHVLDGVLHLAIPNRDFLVGCSQFTKDESIRQGMSATTKVFWIGSPRFLSRSVRESLVTSLELRVGGEGTDAEGLLSCSDLSLKHEG